MKILSYILLLLSAVNPRLISAPALDSNPLLEPSSDRILHRTAVPNKLLKQGEVRLLRRGQAVVVQTLLHSSHLDRVLKKISRSELKSWPVGEPGHTDMRRYVETLALQCKAAKARAKRDGGKARLMIEFVAMDQEVLVAFYRPEQLSQEKDWEPGERKLLQVLQLGPDYVRPNIELIIQDAFKLDVDKTRKLLREFNWEPRPRLQPGKRKP